MGESGGIMLFRAATARVWYRNLGGYPSGLAPAPDGGIYVVNPAGLRALRTDGSERWFLERIDLTSGPVLGTNGALYITGFAPRMLAA